MAMGAMPGLWKFGRRKKERGHPSPTSGAHLPVAVLCPLPVLGKVIMRRCEVGRLEERGRRHVGDCAIELLCGVGACVVELVVEQQRVWLDALAKQQR